ncbi:MAG: 2-hydroxyacid dehydrogenase [Aminivibrio sp.]|jgi:phosphoglycerate dehydrogenase-like enzyme
MEKTIVVTCPAPDSVREAVREGAADYARILYLEDASEEERAGMLSSASGILSFFFNKEVKEEEYPLLENLEVMQSISTGLDFLPFDKIPEKLVLLCNAGGWAPQIAEHTMALLLALTRRIIPLHNDLARGVFNRDAFSPMSLNGKVLTVAGYGGIGRATAELARAFGMKIRALNSTGKTNGNVDFMGTLKDLETVLPGTDVLLLSLPLNRHTRGVIGKKELNLMKKNAILLNVARAPLVVEEDLFNHLKENPEFQAGFDVWWKEPTWGGGDFALDYPFMELQNIAGSPHNSNRCDQGMEKATQAAAENMISFLRGEKYGGLIRREDYTE